MRLIRHLWFVVRQMLGFAVRTRRPGVVILLVLAAVALVAGVAVQFVAPAAIYPLI